LLLARHFDQQLEDLGAVQQDLIAYMQSSGIDSSEHYKRRMSSPDIHLMLKTKIGALSYVGGVSLFDSEGMLINSSGVWPVPAINVADRPYFKAFKSDPKSPAVLVEPVHSRVTGAWTTVIARKVTGPNGEFLGAIGSRLTSKSSSPAWRLETTPQFRCSIATGPCWPVILMWKR
jgi:hypothetical protein